MKRNLKLITSIITLSLTLVTLLTSIYGWYTENNVAEATGLKVSTYDAQVDFELQSYDTTKNEYVASNSIVFNNIRCNDVFYFRFKITPRESDLDVSTLKFDINFTNYSSAIQDNTLTYNSSKKTITYSDVKLYDVVTDETSGENTVTFGNKTLYKITDNKITLKDYKIEETFKAYSNQKQSDNALGTDGVLLNDQISTYSGNTNYIEKSGTDYYYYFALKFNEDLSLVIDNGIESSNAYEFQELTISEITIKRVV